MPPGYSPPEKLAQSICLTDEGTRLVDALLAGQGGYLNSEATVAAFLIFNLEELLVDVAASSAAEI